jgi:hypothetical protein
MMSIRKLIIRRYLQNNAAILGAQLSEANCREPGEGPTAGQTAAQGGEDRAGQAAAQERMPLGPNFQQLNSIKPEPQEKAFLIFIYLLFFTGCRVRTVFI